MWFFRTHQWHRCGRRLLRGWRSTIPLQTPNQWVFLQWIQWSSRFTQHEQEVMKRGPRHLPTISLTSSSGVWSSCFKLMSVTLVFKRAVGTSVRLWCHNGTVTITTTTRTERMWSCLLRPVRADQSEQTKLLKRRAQRVNRGAAVVWEKPAPKIKVLT